MKRKKAGLKQLHTVRTCAQNTALSKPLPHKGGCIKSRGREAGGMMGGDCGCRPAARCQVLCRLLATPEFCVEANHTDAPNTSSIAVGDFRTTFSVIQTHR